MNTQRLAQVCGRVVSRHISVLRKLTLMVVQGTWQFLSIRLLKNDSAVHEVSDDIESFIYILLLVAARYAPNTLSAGKRAVFLETFHYRFTAPWAHKARLSLCSVRTLCLKTLPFEALLTSLGEQLELQYDEDDGAKGNERRGKGDSKAIVSTRVDGQDIRGQAEKRRMEEDEGRCGETAVAQDAPRSPEFTREKEGVYKGHSGREEEEVNMYRGIDQSSRRACGQNARRNEMKNWDHTW